MSFSRLLDKPVSLSCYIALSLDDTAKFETCIRGQIKSQSFSLWALAMIFEYLKDTNCVPDDASMTTALNSQAKISFSVAAFLQQVRRESLVSHPSRSTHLSAKHALLSTPSSFSLFDEEVIRSSLTQVKDDSQLSLLENLSSLKDGKLSASTASTSGHRWHDSSSSLSSLVREAFPGALTAPSDLLRRPLAIGRTSPLKLFYGLPLRKRIFRSRSHVPCLSGPARPPSIGPSGGTRGQNIGW